MFENYIYISPHFIPEDYTEIKLRIDSPESDWEKAIDIFLDRINGRYFNAIKLLLDKTRRFQGNSTDYSFSAMALMCLMIETLHQFYNGLDETEPRRHREAFVNFLTRSNNFRFEFNRHEAQLFYSHIRNGILHQAQTKGNTQITISSYMMVEEVPDGIKVDVMLFYKALKKEISHYVSMLRCSDEFVIRENFIRKMGFITKDNV